MKKREEVAKRKKELKSFVDLTNSLTFVYLLIHAAGPFIILYFHLPVWTWILVLLLLLFQSITCRYYDNINMLPDDKDGKELIDPRFIYPYARVDERSPNTSMDLFLWQTLGFLHWRYRSLQVLKLRAQEIQDPVELQDDRLPALYSFFHNMEAWDFNVKMINRLIDQAELGLIPLEDIASLITELRSDEKYLCDNMEYARRLLLEGTLGTSIGVIRSTDEIVDQIDGRLTEIVKHQEELRELSGKIAARMEVFSR